MEYPYHLDDACRRSTLAGNGGQVVIVIPGAESGSWSFYRELQRSDHVSHAAAHRPAVTCFRRSLPEVHPIQGGANPAPASLRRHSPSIRTRAAGSRQHVTVQGRDRDAVPRRARISGFYSSLPTITQCLTCAACLRICGTSLAVTPVRRGHHSYFGADARWGGVACFLTRCTRCSAYGPRCSVVPPGFSLLTHPRPDCVHKTGNPC